jgi:hypothetical protein
MRNKLALVLLALCAHAGAQQLLWRAPIRVMPTARR